jgi:hypothetical protein
MGSEFRHDGCSGAAVRAKGVVIPLTRKRSYGRAGRLAFVKLILSAASGEAQGRLIHACPALISLHCLSQWQCTLDCLLSCLYNHSLSTPFFFLFLF